MTRFDLVIADNQDESIANVAGFGVKKFDRGVMYPTMDTNFYVSSDTRTVFDAISSLAVNAPQNIIVTGPQGQGKTGSAIWLAAALNRPCLIMNCATIRETKDWFGYRYVENGQILWHKSDFVRAVTMGDCVIVLDEFNRLHTTLHNALYPLLDERRITFVEEIDDAIQVAPGTIFFATCNVGFAHGGTYTLDSAIEDRFGFRVDLDFLPAEQEAAVIVAKTGVDRAVADRLARLGRDVRRKARGASATLSKAISTRQLLHTATLMKELGKKNVPITKALEFTVIPYYSKEGGTESERSQVLQIVQGIFP